LVRAGGEGVKTDDWHNYQVKEGTSGWKDGLSFERAYAYQPARAGVAGHHLYRMIVTRQAGLDIVAVAYGRTGDSVWNQAYEELHRKGLMPDEAYEAHVARVLAKQAATA
jgi:hypothetical protein